VTPHPSHEVVVSDAPLSEKHRYCVRCSRYDRELVVPCPEEKP
jgi:hypothetical protein